MRTMAKAVGLLLVIAFVAGAWQARYGKDDGPAGSSRPFRTSPLERSRSNRPTAELRSVEALERGGADRVVFTFQGPAPGYRVRYVPKVTGQSGRRLPLAGEAFLEVRFDPARAHDPAGRPTFPTATLTPGSPVVREVRFAGDFEGRVRFGIGLAGRGGFRVVELADPTRVVVDVAG
jgi:hypothetical protein